MHPTRMGETLRYTSGGQTIRVDAFEPASDRSGPAIVLLHGSGGNAGRWLEQFAAPLRRMGIALYAIHYFDRTGTQRASMEIIADGVHVPQWIDAITAGLQFIGARPGVDANRIALLGVSLGAYLALGLVTLPATPRIRAIVEISGGLHPDFSAAVNANFPATLILHGEADTVVPVEQARLLDARLTAAGAPHTLKLLPGEGHWFSPAGQMQILMAIASFLPRYLS